MYYDFFGFREPPFSIAPDPRYLYLSERHKEALAHLMYGVQGQGGFIVITGEVGTGKTTVSRCFIENAPEHVDIALILNPRLSAGELLASVCDEFGIDYPEPASIKQLVDRINRHLLEAHARGRHQVLMIDEAQNLSADVLEQLRLLTNLETAEKKLLQIVLLGQPELQDILARPELRQLNQRVTARYHLDALDRDELSSYLHYRLGVAGVKVDLFTPSAIRTLFRKSHGVPRLINLISDRALLGAYSEGLQHIESAHVRAAAKEVGSAPIAGQPKQDNARLSRLALAAVMVAVAVGGWAVVTSQRPVPVAAVGETTDMVKAPDPSSQAEDSGQAAVVAAEDGIEQRSGLNPDNAVSGAIERPDAAADESDDEALTAFEFEAHGLSTTEAYDALFRLWGYSWTPSDYPLACNYASVAGLSCLHRQGSRRSMEGINRPAILELKGPQGGTAYLTLVRLENDTATVHTGEGLQEMSFAEIQQYWFGRFTVLWQLPPYMAWEGDPETLPRESREGVWMSARMMQLAGLHAEDDGELERVSRMIRDEQVRWYQKVKGLKQDGVVGAMTLIQMSNDLDRGVPKLVPGQTNYVGPLGADPSEPPRPG